eukprot:8540-Amorphochlora_amoeboformis.AAC.1
MCIISDTKYTHTLRVSVQQVQRDYRRYGKTRYKATQHIILHHPSSTSFAFHQERDAMSTAWPTSRTESTTRLRSPSTYSLDAFLQVLRCIPLAGSCRSPQALHRVGREPSEDYVSSYSPQGVGCESVPRSTRGEGALGAEESVGGRKGQVWQILAIWAGLPWGELVWG